MFIQEHNCETNKIIFRQLTEEEIAQRESEYQVEQEEKTAKAAQRAALLERLGITEEEAQLLLGGN